MKSMRTVLWRNDEFQQYEYGSFNDTGQGISLEGVVVAAVDHQPLRIHYRVTCDRQGLTRSAEVDAVGGLGEHHLRLAADDQRDWRVNDQQRAEFQGISDVDLGFSPATNALPIRRLNLPIGASQTLTTVWVRFPQFDVIAFPQRYTRLDHRRYRFESLLDDFQAELVVDELGMVQQYGRFWEAIAAGQDD